MPKNSNRSDHTSSIALLSLRALERTKAAVSGEIRPDWKPVSMDWENEKIFWFCDFLLDGIAQQTGGEARILGSSAYQRSSGLNRQGIEFAGRWTPS